MLWFRVMSNMPHHPSIQRVLHTPTLGTAGLGSLLLLWAFSAMYGRDRTSPGRCVDSDGDAIPRVDLIRASLMTEDQFDTLLQVLVETKGIDVTAWLDRQELSFPGMRTRADEYTKQLAKRAAQSTPAPPPTVTATTLRLTAPPETPRPTTRFNAFWSLYPRKIEKKRARAAWTTLKAETNTQLYQVIMTGTQRLVDEGRDITYIPAPQRFLSHRRFEDERSSVVTQTPVRPTSAEAMDRATEIFLAEQKPDTQTS